MRRADAMRHRRAKKLGKGRRMQGIGKEMAMHMAVKYEPGPLYGIGGCVVPWSREQS
jgi:hypothetical protein